MKISMKRETLNDVLSGLLVAATFAAIAPTSAWADLASATSTADTSIMKPALHVVGLVSYGLGAVMTVAGIAHAKKHADNPSSNPLGPALGKLGAGGAFLAAPSVIGMLQKTATGTTSDTASFTSIGF
jgi:hypothetical protein